LLRQTRNKNPYFLFSISHKRQSTAKLTQKRKKKLDFWRKKITLKRSFSLSVSNFFVCFVFCFYWKPGGNADMAFKRGFSVWSKTKQKRVTLWKKLLFHWRRRSETMLFCEVVNVEFTTQWEPTYSRFLFSKISRQVFLFFGITKIEQSWSQD
jgi:hypothetical protein